MMAHVEFLLQQWQVARDAFNQAASIVRNFQSDIFSLQMTQIEQDASDAQASAKTEHKLLVLNNKLKIAELNLTKCRSDYESLVNQIGKHQQEQEAREERSRQEREERSRQEAREERSRQEAREEKHRQEEREHARRLQEMVMQDKELQRKHEMDMKQMINRSKL
jgi:hypothetical protein